MRCFVTQPEPRRALAAAFALTTAIYVATAAAQPVMVLSPGIKLAFDFSTSPNGGVSVGSFDNVAFVLDLNRPRRKLAVRTGQQSTDAIASYDYADCSTRHPALLERSIGGLAAGTPAFVDYVDIELAPAVSSNPVASGGVCYGFRTSTGWQWRLAVTPLTYDATGKRLRGRIWVKEPNVDALKLVFDYSLPGQTMRTVQVTTQPLTSKIVK
jgi:hypothetical protein